VCVLHNVLQLQFRYACVVVLWTRSVRTVSPNLSSIHIACGVQDPCAGSAVAQATSAGVFRA
jgi:hypothetical protein